MKVTLVGSRYFGALVFEALRKDGVEFAGVVAPAADDRLAQAAKSAGVPLHVLENPKHVPGEAIPLGTDLIVAAHTHARVSNEALARSRRRTGASSPKARLLASSGSARWRRWDWHS